jgi:hypothetical protein
VAESVWIGWRKQRKQGAAGSGFCFPVATQNGSSNTQCRRTCRSSTAMTCYHLHSGRRAKQFIFDLLGSAFPN